MAPLRGGPEETSPRRPVAPPDRTDLYLRYRRQGHPHPQNPTTPRDSNAATALIAQGTDVKTAQVRLGHSDPRLTLSVYAQATAMADRVAADAVGALFMGSLPAHVQQMFNLPLGEATNQVRGGDEEEAGNAS